MGILLLDTVYMGILLLDTVYNTTYKTHPPRESHSLNISAKSLISAVDPSISHCTVELPDLS